MRLLTKFAATLNRVAPDAPPAPTTIESLAPRAASHTHARDVVNVAHRGASAYVPENTLAAIRTGIAMGSGFVEVDVQRTRDGELVLVHDTDLARTTDARRVFPGRGPWRVGDFTYDEIRRLDAGSWKSSDHEGERIPTLAEAIDVIRQSGSGLLLEVKQPELYPGIAGDVAGVLRSLPGYVDAAVAARGLVVQSFHFATMAVFRELEPTVSVGLLGRPAPERLPQLASWADQVNPRHKTVDASYVAAVHDAGMDCLVWTVNEATNMNRAIDLDVDGVITNRPDVLGQVLRDRAAAAA